MVPTLCLDSGLVSPLRLRWVKGVCVFRCNLPPVLLAEWPGSFTCHCGNTMIVRTPSKCQHTKLTLKKKILPPLLPGFEPATFQSRVWRSSQQAVPADLDYCAVFVDWVGVFLAHVHSTLKASERLSSNFSVVSFYISHLLALVASTTTAATFA